ncbi:GNAT family N-acetyltransferase [Kitasatospora sp. NPDC057223]|uniref:GNAT family N-acetyltransferase n=1 Tax=Kitasatospora sp. NPDC057223 TaxID=3346055 RepID=UPI00363C7291
MRFQWDWLSPVVTVPYVPTLGPVHPAGLGPELFTSVIAMASTGRFLAHDKDRRWSDTKAESVLPLDIDHRPGRTIIPTLTRRGAGTVKVHLYGGGSDALAKAAELAAKLAATHSAGAARVISFQAPGEAPRRGTACTRVQLREFTADRPTALPPHVQPLESHPPAVRATFTEFANKLSGEGFAFLHSRMQAGGVGPVLVTETDGRISGAIGPMETMTDHQGRARLLPQYFGVLPDYRGRGYGRALWRAAMYWGNTNGAGYQLLQTEIGGASDILCRSEGLTDLGLVHITTV